MRTKRVLRAAVAFLFAFGVLAADLTPLRLPPQTASAVTQADIDKLKKESNALSSKKSEVNKQLSALKKDKANTLKRKALLDQQIDLISEEIANTEQQIAQYEALIEQTEQELSETQAQEADQYELFCKRVRAMEERGTVSYWSVLFQSSSFEELLGAMDFISEVMEADQRVIDDLRVLQAQMRKSSRRSRPRSPSSRAPRRRWRSRTTSCAISAPRRPVSSRKWRRTRRIIRTCSPRSRPRRKKRRRRSSA